MKKLKFVSDPRVFFPLFQSLTYDFPVANLTIPIYFCFYLTPVNVYIRGTSHVSVKLVLMDLWIKIMERFDHRRKKGEA